jgi:hypothetical protein
MQLWSSAPPKDSTPMSSPSSSSMSLSPTMKRLSQTSSSSSSSFGRHSKKKSTPSIFSTSSRSSRTSIAIEPPSYIRTSSSTSTIFAAPVASCVVLFAHKAPTFSARVEGRDITRSFLIIESQPITFLLLNHPVSASEESVALY